MIEIFKNIEFLANFYFYFLILIPFFVYFIFFKRKKWIIFIFTKELKNIFWKNSLIFYLKNLLILLIFTNFIFIFANPNIANVEKKVKKNWIDIVLVLDVSGSMDAEDLKPTRIEAAKNVISNFLSKMKTDRVWLVIFAWKPFESIPLTFDYNILKESIKNISTKNINQRANWLSWTAVWDAILMSKNLFWLKEDWVDLKNREKVIILLTDWDANVWIDPILAWKNAFENWIKIYTIWIWSEQWWLITYEQMWIKQKFQVPPMNDEILREVAKITKWEFFRAEDNDSFENIFANLESLEKNDIDIKITKQFSEYYFYFLLNLFILTFLLLIFNFIKIESKKTF